MNRWLGGVVLAGILLTWGLITVEAREIVRFGNDVVIEEGMKVDQAVAIGGDITVEGVVEEDVVAVGGSVMLGSTAVVKGDAVSIGGTIEQEEGAELRGDVVEVGVPGMSSAIDSVSNVRWHRLFWGFRIMAFIGFLAVALLIVSVVPKPVKLISSTVEKHPLKVILWGILGIVLMIPLTVLLAVSLVGIVLIPVEFLLIGCGFVVGYVAVARLVGERITVALRRPDQPIFWETLWGVVLLWLIGWVPVLGWVVKGMAWLLGLGGVIVALLSLRDRQERGDLNAT